ncbi:hypothetical protein [Nostocoides veronense]|uniref:hypothetical protein n=1 Tax=Nostocoides veronense TaxID=330836 RepID=UPI0031DFE73D
MPRRAVGIAEFDLDEAVEDVQRLDEPPHQIGLADPGHPPQVDDRGPGEQFWRDIPDHDGVAEFVDDPVDHRRSAP